MKAKYFITRCGFLVLLIVSTVGMIGCMSKEALENFSKNEIILEKSATFPQNDFKDADMVIKVPDTAPPHLKTLGTWSDICLAQEVIKPLSLYDGRHHIAYFTKAHQGYLYSVVENADEPDPPAGVQNVFKRNTLHRVHETGSLVFEDEKSRFITPENKGWRITYFAVSDHYIWWCEVDDASSSWKLYEMPISGGKPSILLEDSHVNYLLSMSPSRMSADQDRLVFQAYDSVSQEDRIYLRLPAQNDTKILARHNRKNLGYFYDPKISGDKVAWSKAQIINEEREMGWCYFYDITSNTCTGIDAGKRCFTEPTITGNHLCVRLKPEGQNFIDHDPQGKNGEEDANTYDSAEIWHYDLAKKTWDFRISNKSPLYQVIGYYPITLLQLNSNGHYLIWRTEPETAHPFIVDLDTQIAYQVPIAKGDGVRINGMDIVSEGLYWKGTEKNAPLNKALLK